jgi:hypothetical protein
MEWFYFIVIAIAIILLIIMLTYVGMRMVGANKSGNSDTVFPPTTNSCPDRWTTIGDVCTIPETNGNNRGIMDTVGLTAINTPGYTSTSKTIDFSDVGWDALGTTSRCAKQKWVNSRGIIWDGVSNYNQC